MLMRVFGGARAELVEILCSVGGGAHKRVDENRQLLALLQEDAPGLLRKRPWVVGWIAENDRMFVRLANLSRQMRLVEDSGAPTATFPRPWPIAEQRGYSGDVLGNAGGYPELGWLRSRPLAQLTDILQVTGGGAHKRLDENRELMELLLLEAPDLLEAKPWIGAWIKANDSVFERLAAISHAKQLRELYALPRGHARPWPGSFAKSDHKP